jgi:hypothetical protein
LQLEYSRAALKSAAAIKVLPNPLVRGDIARSLANASRQRASNRRTAMAIA